MRRHRHVRANSGRGSRSRRRRRIRRWCKGWSLKLGSRTGRIGEVTSASLAGGRCCKVHPVVEALCCHPLAKGPSAVAGGGVGA